MKPTQAEIKEILNYDPRVGTFTWKKTKPKSKIKPGMQASSVDNKGYLRVKIDGTSYSQARLAWVYMTGYWPKKLIDHKDGNPKNNKWENLREANHSMNMANCHNFGACKKGVTHVRHRPGLYRATITVNGRFISLGFFRSEDEAHTEYCRAAQQYFGEFARFK